MTNLEEPNDSNMGNCCLVALAKETAGLKGGNSMFICSALKTAPQFFYPCFFFISSIYAIYTLWEIWEGCSIAR